MSKGGGLCPPPLAMPFWLGTQKIGREWKNEENGEKKRKMGKKMKYFAFWLGIKKKGARKKESEKKGKKREKKEIWYGGQGWHIMPFWLGYK